MENLLASLLIVAIFYILAALPKSSTVVEHEKTEYAPESSAKCEEQHSKPVEKIEPKFQKQSKKSAKNNLEGLTGLNIRQLKKLASERKIKNYGRLTKIELLTALQTA